MPSDEQLADLLNLCEDDPNQALEFIKSRREFLNTTTDQNFVHFIKFCEALALGSKGFLNFWRVDMDCADISDGDMIYFRDKLGITDEQLGYLEIALQKIKEIYDFDPGYINIFRTKLFSRRFFLSRIDLQ